MSTARISQVSAQAAGSATAAARVARVTVSTAGASVSANSARVSRITVESAGQTATEPAQDRFMLWDGTNLVGTTVVEYDGEILRPMERVEIFWGHTGPVVGNTARVASVTAETVGTLVNDNAARFAGDPGKGKFYVGGRQDQLTWSSSETAIANWETRMAPWSGGQKLSIIRQFESASSTTGWTNRALTATHLANDRMVHVSFKLPGEVSQAVAAAGTGAAFTTWMDALAAAFKSYAPKPIWWTFWHEPENDANFNTVSGSAEYRAICRNIVRALRARDVDNSTFWTTGYMCPWTFGDRGGTRDWRWWYPDWKGTTAAGSSKDAPNRADFYLRGALESVVEGIGLDVYSWWDEGEATTGTKAYEPFSKLFGWAYDRTAFLGQAYAIMEHGVQALHTGTVAAGDAVFMDDATLAYLSAMFDTMQAKNVVACMVYNYALVQNHWRLELADPNRARYQGYGLGMARPAHVHPTQIGWY